MKYPIIILAGSEQEYLDYLVSAEIDSTDAVFISNSDALLSLHASGVAIVGTFRKFLDWESTRDLALSRVRGVEEPWFAVYLRIASKRRLEFLLNSLLAPLSVAEQESLLDSISDSNFPLEGTRKVVSN